MHPLIKEVNKEQLKRVPEIKTGYTVRVHQKITEGTKERIQVFEGLVIKVGHGADTEKTITIRKIVQGIGVEKIFPINSPNITKIDVKKKAKVRRSKLYYMRDRSGKSARLQERHVTDQERAEEEDKMDALIEEAVKAEEKRRAEEAENSGDITELSVSADSQPEADDVVETQDSVSQDDEIADDKTDEPDAAELPDDVSGEEKEEK